MLISILVLVVDIYYSTDCRDLAKYYVPKFWRLAPHRPFIVCEVSGSVPILVGLHVTLNLEIRNMKV